MQGPLTPQQQLPTLAPSQEELLWQYRAQMAPQMAPSSVTSPFSSVPTTLPSQPVSFCDSCTRGGQQAQRAQRTGLGLGSAALLLQAALAVSAACEESPGCSDCHLPPA